jgi:hypothetical protein
MSDLKANLVRFEDTWVRLGMPHTRWLAPGLSPGETRRQLEAENLEAPSEILDWLSWHNGVGDTFQDARPLLGPSVFEPLSLARALDERRAMLGIAEYLESSGQPEDAEPAWELSWLPIGRDAVGRLLTADLRDTNLATVPVRTVDVQDPNFSLVKANSLSEVVEFWTEVLETYCAWSASAGCWEYDFAALPRDIRLRDLL